MTSSDTRRLAKLFHHRWSVPILAELCDGPGVRVSQLVHRLNGSRGAIQQALDFLAAKGWIRRLEHHTHPLAPEYVLTGKAVPVARAVLELQGSLVRHTDPKVAWKKWNIPVLGAIADSGFRFSELVGRVPGITDRALSSALRNLEANGLLVRKVAPTLRSAVAYAPTAQGKALRKDIQRLADVMA